MVIVDFGWKQNIEYIFTKEELDDFVEKGYLEIIELHDKKYYIKKGTKDWLLWKELIQIEVGSVQCVNMKMRLPTLEIIGY